MGPVPLKRGEAAFAGEAARVAGLHEQLGVGAVGDPAQLAGEHVNSDYVYVMNFDGDKIGRMTKIWHAGIAMRELGWA